tara:strand:- start:543 stop:833 length:291 start_codon:yes stop_codon:yes gene_type:complete
VNVKIVNVTLVSVNKMSQQETKKKTLRKKVFPKQHRIGDLNLKIWKIKKRIAKNQEIIEKRNEESKAAHDLLMKLKNKHFPKKKSSRDKLKIKKKK